MTTSTQPSTLPNTIDVAVIGSGAAGFAAALTARSMGLDVHLFEKAQVFGGTTALSGGVAWLPGNPLMTEGDSADEALNYLRQHAGNRTDDARLQAFVTYAPEMVAYFRQQGFMQVTRMAGFPDYKAETPGGDAADNDGGRSLEPKVFSSRKLGSWRRQLRHRARRLPVVGTMTELRQLAAVRTDLRTFLKAWRAIPRTLWGRLTGAHHLSSGAALIGWLAYAAKRRGIPVHLSTPLQSLHLTEGRVAAVTVLHQDQPQLVRTRLGVILASGGFDHNTELRRAHLPPEASTDYSSGADSNTGDGQLAAQAIGSALSAMDDAWWAPTCQIPGVGPQIVIFERGKPGQIIVDANGNRFTNEAEPYGDFVRAMMRAQRQSGCAIPAFMIFDQTFRERYPVANLMPGITPQSAIDSGLLTRADTLETLAHALGISVEGLTATVTSCNAMAEQGVDTEFGRGSFAFDRYAGDPTVTPNPCLAPITRAPFYALKIYPGDLGAHGGVLTDATGQALDEAGQPIGGLYAAGNCAASPLGGFYPGAGGTIGPAMTFGYIAAKHLAAQASTT